MRNPIAVFATFKSNNNNEKKNNVGASTRASTIGTGASDLPMHTFQKSEVNGQKQPQKELIPRRDWAQTSTWKMKKTQKHNSNYFVRNFVLIMGINQGLVV